MPNNDSNEIPDGDPTETPVNDPTGAPGNYLTDVQLANRYGVHRSTPWRWTNTDPTFPKPVKLSPQCSRWKLSEIEAWEAYRANSSK